MSAHTFALYLPTPLGDAPTITITQPEFCHRIITVLRLRIGEQCLLFDDTQAAQATISALVPGKKCSVTLQIDRRITHVPLAPAITLAVGMTKKSSFEDIVFHATQLGVQTIQPLVCTKSYTRIYTDKDFQHFRTQAIAAAEQSKQFILPTILPPQPLEHLILPSGQRGIFFEADAEVIKEKPNQTHEITVVVGPEGGLTPEEAALLAARGFSGSRLTPHILRTQEAVLLGVGMLRIMCS